jgi:hypothetical protein
MSIKIIKEEIHEMQCGMPGYITGIIARGVNSLIDQFGDRTTDEGIINFLDQLSKRSLMLKKMIEKRL